jgi:hypothetical protein
MKFLITKILSSYFFLEPYNVMKYWKSRKNRNAGRTRDVDYTSAQSDTTLTSERHRIAA